MKIPEHLQEGAKKLLDRLEREGQIVGRTRTHVLPQGEWVDGVWFPEQGAEGVQAPINWIEEDLI